MLSRLAARVRSAFASRRISPIRIVGAQSLHHGVMLYAAEIDGRRLIFAAAPHCVTLLTEYAVR